MIRMFKMMVSCIEKKIRRSEEGADERIKIVKKTSMEVMGTESMSSMFEKFSDFLVLLNEQDLNTRVRNLTITMFSCYEEDFKSAEDYANVLPHLSEHLTPAI